MRFFLDSLFYFIFLINKQMAWKNHYFAKGISLDSKKECFVTNVRETDFEVLIQESFLRNVKRNSLYEVTLSVADPGRGLGPPPLIFRQNRKMFFYFEIGPPTYLTVWMTAPLPPPLPPLIWRVWIGRCLLRNVFINSMGFLAVHMNKSHYGLPSNCTLF